MQANCPQCQNKIVIDDARVPERAFSVKCPKCQTAVKFPGKAAAAPAAASEAAPVAAAPSGPSADELRAQMMSQLRREITGGDQHSGERALVALPDRGQAGAITLTLTRQGYGVETIDDWAEGARLLEQGVFTVVVTALAAGPAGKETLYQRINRLSPDTRRRMFVLLVADNVKTGDGLQAYVLQADLVVNSKDIGSADVPFRQALQDRQRMYQVYNDARTRFESVI